LLANGWSEPGKHRSIVFTTGVSTGTTSLQAGVLPPSSYIREIIASKATENAVAGGIAVRRQRRG
jgi:hypothetical protein